MKKTRLAHPLTFILSVPLALLLVTVSFAEFLYRNSLGNRSESAFRKQLVAATLNPINQTYRRALAKTSLVLALTELKIEHLSWQRRRAAENYLETAITQIETVLKTNPNNPENQKTAFFIYTGLIGTVSEAASIAESHLLAAIRLSPNDPSLRTELGFFYKRLGRDKEAVVELSKALELMDNLGAK